MHLEKLVYSDLRRNPVLLPRLHALRVHSLRLQGAIYTAMIRPDPDGALQVMRGAGVRLGQEDRKLCLPYLFNSANRAVVTELVQGLHAGPLKKIKISGQYDGNSQRRPHPPTLLLGRSNWIVWSAGWTKIIDLDVGVALLNPRLLHLQLNDSIEVCVFLIS